MKKALDVLHIEDNDNDVLLIMHELKKYWADINHHRVEKLVDLEEALKKKWDVIISDFTLPDFDGLTVLRMVRGNGIDTPFIVVSGRVEEDIAASMMRLGANDYVMKDNLKRLAPAIERELKTAEERLKIAKPESTEHKKKTSPDEGTSARNQPAKDSGIAMPNTDSIKARHKAVINILYAANLIRKHQEKILERQNLSEPQFNVLSILRRQAPKEVSLNFIKDEIANKTSDVSRIVERMINAGLVHAAINIKDKRLKDHTITQKGLDALAEMDKCADEMFFPEAFASEEDAEQMYQGLQKMLTQMRGR